MNSPEAWHEPLLSGLVSSAQKKYMVSKSGTLWAKMKKKKVELNRWLHCEQRVRQSSTNFGVQLQYTLSMYLTAYCDRPT